MSKVRGSFASIIKGVSQQAPADRLEGQHGEQVNLISDPVRGLVRRNGSILLATSSVPVDETPLEVPGPGEPLPRNAVDTAQEDSSSFRCMTWTSNDETYDLLYRSREKVGDSSHHLPSTMVYSRTAGFLETVTAGTDTQLVAFETGGYSAVAALGRYVLLAGNAVTPTQLEVDEVATNAGRNAAVAWVRGGSYSRTYKVTVTRASDSATITASYTTKSASYETPLDTSDILFTDPEYQKKVNDRVYAYNSAVNKWIADSAKDSTPDNIAENLRLALIAAGFTTLIRIGAHLCMTDVQSLTVEDGGVGAFLVALGRTTRAADEVTDIHYVGKTIQVTPNGSDEGSMYLKAFAREPGSTDLFQQVVWRESAGVSQTPQGIVAIGTVHEGKWFLASSPAALQALLDSTAVSAPEVPQLQASRSGDLISSPRPYFFGQRITAITVFQDRLVLCSGSTVNMSRPGDYFNFYRQSTLVLGEDDPVEVYALGSEGDTIRQATVYDRNLLLLGDQFHYTMSGRVAQTPTAASISVQATIQGTSGALPKSAMQHTFFLKEDTQLAACRLMQIQLGLFQDSPAVEDVSKQLRDYINGSPAEMAIVTGPSAVFVRTEHFLRAQGAFPIARPWGIYCYNYLDQADGQRLTESWSAWEWHEALGTPIGLTTTSSGDGILVFTMAFGRNESSQMVRSVLVQQFSARPDPTGLPYLDGLRPASEAEATGLFTTAAEAGVKEAVYTAPGAGNSFIAPSERYPLLHPHYTVGDAAPEGLDTFRWTGVQGYRTQYIAAYPAAPTTDLWTGLAFPAYVDLTQPFVRDSDGRVQDMGRLTLTWFRCTLTKTAGFQARVRDLGGTSRTVGFTGEYERLRYDQTIPVGRDCKYVQVRLEARDWMPLTINGITWQGQWFQGAQSA